MHKIEKSITVHAPVKRVFDYVSDPARLPALWPNIAETYDIETVLSGRRRYRWLYRLCGVRFEGESETVEFQAGERLIEHWRGGLNGTVGWHFAADGDDTRVTLTVELAVPPPLHQKHSLAEIETEHSRSLEAALRILKGQLEGSPAPA